MNNSLANISGHIKSANKKGIHVFLGLGTSDQALVAIKTLNETRSILITPTASSDEIAQRSDRVVMLYPRNSQFAFSLAESAKKRGYKKILQFTQAIMPIVSVFTMSLSRLYQKKELI